MKIKLKWVVFGILTWLVVGAVAEVVLGVSSFSGLIGAIAGVVVGILGYKNDRDTQSSEATAIRPSDEGDL